MLDAVTLCVGVLLGEGVNVRDAVGVPEGVRDNVPVREGVRDCDRVAACVPLGVSERLCERVPDCELVLDRDWL